MISSAPPKPPPKGARLLLALTSARLLAGPLLAGFILWAQTQSDEVAPAAFGAAAVVFFAAALTDWLDGALARRWNAVTPLGAALDHAADKALVAPVLVALSFGVLPFDLAFAAALIVARDVAVAGLREGLSQSGASLPVGPWGKLKAVAEMAAILIVLALPAASVLGPAVAPALETLARAAFWIAAGLALFSAGLYARAAFTSL